MRNAKQRGDVEQKAERAFRRRHSNPSGPVAFREFELAGKPCIRVKCPATGVWADYDLSSWRIRCFRVGSSA